MNTTATNIDYLPAELIRQAAERRAENRAKRLAQLLQAAESLPQNLLPNQSPATGGNAGMSDLPPIPRRVPETLSPTNQDGTVSAQYQLARLLSGLDSSRYFGLHKVMRRGFFHLLGCEFFVPELSTPPIQRIYCICDDSTRQLFVYDERLENVYTLYR